jgi:hypothetical protein
MSVAAYPQDYAYDHAAPAHKLGDWTEGYSERSKFQPLLMLPCLVLAGTSWVGGGIQFLTDLSFVLFTLLLAGLFLNELFRFPSRFGIGGLICFGGALFWWCYDYNFRWLGHGDELSEVVLDPTAGVAVQGMQSVVLAKAAFIHMLFVACMMVGLQFRRWMLPSRLMFKVVEPNRPAVAFIIVLAIFFLSMIPYLFLSTQDVFTTLYLSIFSGRTGESAVFTVGRTGNVNYSWGGYVNQLVALGYIGGTLAAYHALFARSVVQSVICWCIFALQVGLAFGTGTRGNVVMIVLPMLLMIFLKYNYVARDLSKKFSTRAYVIVLSLMTAMLFVVQVQAYFRGEGFGFEQFAEVKVTHLAGNEMFTTTLPGIEAFPGRDGFIDEPFPYAGVVYTLPKTAFWFVINPIPRVLWNDKPIDKAFSKYNAMTTGRSEEDNEGTTISRGAAGDPYMKYGLPGVIQIGILYGWLMRNTEVAIRQASGRYLALIAILGLATFMFRAFRDLFWHDLYPVMYSVIFMSVICYALNLYFPKPQPYDHQQA